MIRVGLVDDQQLVRAGFRMLIDSQPDMTVVAEAGDGAAAVQTLTETPAEVVLMDVRMPVLDGIAATAALTAAQPDLKVIVLTTFDLDEYVMAAIRAGASGFLLKDAPPEELLGAIRTVQSGDAVIAPSATKRLLDKLISGGGSSASAGGVAAAQRGDPTAPGGSTTSSGTTGSSPAPSARPSSAASAAIASLTGREREVLELMARGLSNQELAAELFVSEATVKTHVSRVLAKLGARDRVQAVVAAYEAGVVAPGE